MYYHHAFKEILYLADVAENPVRWSLGFAEFDFEVVQHLETVHQAADAVSRLPTDNADDTSPGDDVSTMLIANDAKPEDAYACSCLNCEEQESFEPTLPLVVPLLKTP